MEDRSPPPATDRRAHQHGAVLLGGQSFRVEVVDDEATRARLWELADRVYPAFAGYRENAARSGRTIPILQLVRR